MDNPLLDVDDLEALQRDLADVRFVNVPYEQPDDCSDGAGEQRA